jgi:glucose-1-phosphate cytidylyltransferase
VENIAKPPVVILAGGRGTRLGSLEQQLPKPMVEVAGVPIILRIMDSYSKYGFSNFIILAGYKSEMIKNFMINLKYFGNNIEINMENESLLFPAGFKTKNREKWRITVLDSGIETETGGRILHAAPILKQHSDFFLTYGDALADVDFEKELDFHLSHAKIGTVLGVSIKSKFGKIETDGSKVLTFAEKTANKGEVISGGFFVFKKEILNYIDSSATILESEPLTRITSIDQLEAFHHQGFWQCMDTPRELAILEQAVLAMEKP